MALHLPSVSRRAASGQCWTSSDSVVTCSSDWSTDFNIELVLDRLKQKEATKRVLFLHSRTFQYSKNMSVLNGRAPSCEEQFVFLRVSSRLEGSPAAFSQQQVKGLSLHVRTTVSSEIRSRPSPW